jgi:hypothetical protein
MTPSSHTVEVVVFPDRARVTRRGAIALEAGLHRIEFSDLPLAIQADSLRAAGRGSAAAVLLGVEARRPLRPPKRSGGKDGIGRCSRIDLLDQQAGELGWFAGAWPKKRGAWRADWPLAAPTSRRAAR